MSFLEKQVRRERTGANIAGITEDVNTASMINPRGISGAPIRAVGTMPVYQMDILDSIERVAQEADKARIANEKIKLNIDLENARLDLEERWAERHDKFSNTDVYNEYLEDKKKLLAEQEKLILSSKYMTKDEKAFAVEKNKIAYREDYAKTASKRNEVVVGQTVDNAQANIEQLITLSSNTDLHDEGKRKEFYQAISEQIRVLTNFGKLSEEEAIVFFGKKVSQAENLMIRNQLEKMVLDESLSVAERENQLNKIKAMTSDKEHMTAYAKEMADLFPTDDRKQAEEYLYAMLTDESSQVVNGIDRQFKAIKRAREQEAREYKQRMRAFEREMKEQRKMATQRQALTNPESQTAVAKQFKKIYGRDIETKDIAMGLVNYDWDAAGDLKQATQDIFPKKTIEELIQYEKELVRSGDTLEEAKNGMTEQAIEMLGGENADPRKVNALLKQVARKTGDNPIVYVYGRNFPELYQANEISKTFMEKENVIINMPAEKISTEKGLFGTKKRKDWEEISKQISSDPNRGDEILKRTVYSIGLQEGISPKDLREKKVGDILKRLKDNPALVQAVRQTNSKKWASEKKVSKLSSEKPKTNSRKYLED